jgi:hypothetical protein
MYSQFHNFITQLLPDSGIDFHQVDLQLKKQQMEVFIQPPGGNGMTFRPVILALHPEHELRWIGRIMVPGIFDGEHQFQLEPIGVHRTRFIHREFFSGLLVPLLWQTLDTQTRQGFEEMNLALKNRVESLV